MKVRTIEDVLAQDELCSELAPVGKPYMCTLPPKHIGDHVAELLDDDGVHARVVHTWPQSPTN